MIFCLLNFLLFIMGQLLCGTSMALIRMNPDLPHGQQFNVHPGSLPSEQYLWQMQIKQEKDLFQQAVNMAVL